MWNGCGCGGIETCCAVGNNSSKQNAAKWRGPEGGVRSEVVVVTAVMSVVMAAVVVVVVAVAVVVVVLKPEGESAATSGNETLRHSQGLVRHREGLKEA